MAVESSASLGPRRLIVNADDFGQSTGINDGIIACHERGIVTSASLMVRWSGARAAAEYARVHPSLSVGLHLDFGERTFRDGEWTPLYDVVQLDDAAAIAIEMRRQLDAFRDLMQQDPTHVDSHQHVHRKAPLADLARALGDELGVPVRHWSVGISYVGSFYGQSGKGDAVDGALTLEHMAYLVGTLPAGTTELGCHPGLRGDAAGMYVTEREREVEVLCHPAMRRLLDSQRIELVSFRSVSRRMSGHDASDGRAGSLPANDR